MSNAELQAKFHHNAQGVLPPVQVDRLVDAVIALDELGDVGALRRLAAPPG